MTVYNRETTVLAAMQSVLVQSFTNFELIVVDDCSHDGSREVIQTLSSDSRVRLLPNERNVGDYPNRNLAASHARGKYLKYVDSDDLIYPHALAHFVAAMERHPDAALAIACQPRANWIFPMLISPPQAYEQEFFGAESLLTESSTSSLIRRDVFERIGGFSGARHYGDKELWLKLAAVAPVLLMGSGLVFCRRHLKSETGVRAAKPSVFVDQQKMIEDRLVSSECPLSPLHRELARALVRANFLRRHFSWWRHGRKSLAFFLEVLRLFKPGLADLLAWVRTPRKPSLTQPLEAEEQQIPDWNVYPAARMEHLRQESLSPVMARE